MSWRFLRYVNGTRMAEGVRINRASNLEEAIEAAVRICPKSPGTVLVLSALPIGGVR